MICSSIEHKDWKKPQPIVYLLRTLTTQEGNLDTIHCNYLAVVWSISFLLPPLERVRFALRTDHHGLSRILNLAYTTDRLAHWRLRLMTFDFETAYRAGIKRQAADALHIANKRFRLYCS